MTEILKISKDRKNQILKKCNFSNLSLETATNIVPENAKLCFVEVNSDSEIYDGEDNLIEHKLNLYYTTNSLDKQWGDDWNDSPYEHNAGIPYEPCVHFYSNGEIGLAQNEWNKEEPNFIIYVVEVDFSELQAALPHEYISYIYDDGQIEIDEVLNSSYSVSKINKGITPWLKKPFKSLYAGSSIDDLLKFVSKN